MMQYIDLYIKDKTMDIFYILINLNKIEPYHNLYLICAQQL